MDISKIKIKIGDNEFEAEGPAESVQRQFDAFKEIVASLASHAPAKPHVDGSKPQQNQDDPMRHPHVPLEHIMHVIGRVVSLTALPPSVEDAALLIMLGHKDLRNNHSVTGQELGDGLAQSGRPVARVDRIMEKAIEDAFVLKVGFKRSTRYRLTNQGLNKVLGIARELIASLPK